MMVSLKRTIAALIVCFKPHVLLTLCIVLVIVHSVVIAIHRGASNSWRLGKQHDITLTMTTLILIVALIWAAFFIFIVRFELRNELESLLILFQCSKRGLRFMGVVGFHIILLTTVALIVSAAVERSIPIELSSSHHYAFNSKHYRNSSASSLSSSASFGARRSKLQRVDIRLSTAHLADTTTHTGLDLDAAKAAPKSHQFVRPNDKIQIVPNSIESDDPYSKRSGKERDNLLAVYKIWLTAIVYAFLYLIIENLVMFYADMSLVEFVHESFLMVVTKVTGIDLSDYPAGEMLFNPLVRHRIR